MKKLNSLALLFLLLIGFVSVNAAVVPNGNMMVQYAGNWESTANYNFRQVLLNGSSVYYLQFSVTRNGNYYIVNNSIIPPIGTAPESSSAWSRVSAESASSSALATNLAGGAANRVAYQSAANTTTFLAAPTESGQFITYTGSALAWQPSIPNYSSTEQYTGQKWVDGSQIYFRTVDFTSADAESNIVLFTLSNTASIINVNGFCDNSAGNKQVSLPNSNYEFSISTLNGDVIESTGESSTTYAGQDCTAAIYYVK